MANNNSIPTFTAADIEKYHRGLLSAREMHDLEKAALDDPFLADALEGYAVAGVNVAADMAELKKRLAGKTGEDQKVIPIGGQKRFPWFRAAAAVLLIGVMALLANQFFFRKKTTDIAAITPPSVNKTVEQGPVDSTKAIADKETAKTNPPTTGYKVPPANNTSSPNSLTTTASTPTGTVTTPSRGYINAEKPAVGETTPGSNNTAAADISPNTNGRRNDNQAITSGGGLKDDASKKATAATTRSQEQEKLKAANAADEDGVTDNTKNANNRSTPAMARKAEEQNYRNQKSNVFRGRVTDANNVGVPFANVTNVDDNAGTYTDAKGNFTLTSPDTVLTVQVRSIGFDNTNVQLRNAAPSNQVVLQEDRKSLSEVVVSNQKPNVAARSRDANKTLEEPEPADGWENYDAYIANNLEVPDELKTKQTNSGTVQVSFEVDKNGDPTNIKVEKSLCSTCDKEAIRLIKDGPKWKRNANKKGRTTVTINF